MSSHSSRVAASGARVRLSHALAWLLGLALCAALVACGGGGGGSSPAPAVTITAQPADVHVTAGASASFTVVASGSVTYQWQRLQSNSWSDIAGATGATLTLGAVADADNGSQFRVNVASSGNAGNNVLSSVVTLTVDPLVVAPAIAAAPADATVMEGLAAAFSVTATGTAPAYQWQRSADGTAWADIAGATSSTLVLPATLGDDGTRIRVRVSNALAAVTSTAAQLHVTPTPAAPVFTTQPASATITTGQTATFNAVATGVPAPELQWMTSADGSTWTQISGATSGSYTTPATTPADNGRWFRAVATNASTTTSASVRLTVNPAPAAPAITAQPADATVQFSQELSVAATGTPTPSYQWQVSTDNGATFTNINNAVFATYTFSPQSLAEDGKQFRVVVSNASGSVTSRAATMSVVAYPAANVAQATAVWQVGVKPLHVTATATGGHLHYHWQVQRGSSGPLQDVTSADAPAYDLPADAPADTSAVCVTATNAAGSSLPSCTGIKNLRWTAIAPLPTSETLHAAGWVDANTVLAGGEVNTILRSIDRGASWTPVFEDGHTNALLRGFATQGSLVLAVGDEGFDARSTDGGLDWIYVGTLDNAYCNGVAFNGAGIAIKVGSFANHGLVRTSSDQGLTWQDVSLPNGTEALNALALNHANVALAVGLSGVVARSTDGGATWATAHTGTTNLYALAFASDTVAVAAGDSGTIWRSTDAGQTWVAASSGTANAISDVHFSSATVGIASTLHGGMLRTTDGGQTWVAASSDASHAYFAARFGPDGNTVVTVGETGRIQRSTDAGLSFIDAVPANAPDLSAVAFNGAGTGLAAGGAGIARTADGGATWSAIAGSGSGLTSVAFASSTVAVAGASNGTLQRSTDGGATWTVLASPTAAQVNAIAFASNGVAIAGTASGLLRSTDSGATWTNVATVSGSFAGVAFADTATAVAVTSIGAVYRTTNGGAAWTLMTTRPFNLHSVAAASATVLVAGGDGGNLSRSVDGGVTWTDAPWGFPSWSFSGVAFGSATNGVAVGGGGVVMRTADGGATWTTDWPSADGYVAGVAISQGRAVAVGRYGLILRSDPI